MAFQYYGEDLQTPQQTEPPAAPRWTRSLANNPYGAYGEMYAKQWYDDPNITDPGAKVQEHLQGYRQQWGQSAPADDASLMNLIASGQAPQQRTASPAQQWNAQPPSQNSDALMKLLMERAQQGTAVNRNDPNIRSQVDPVVAQQERASRNYLADFAERAGPNANIQGERRMTAERQGQAAGALEAEVIGREIDARRQEIAQALSLAVATGNQREALALQQQLAYLNDAARTADRGQQNDQFMRELALREFDLNNAWDYRWAGV